MVNGWGYYCFMVMDSSSMFFVFNYSIVNGYGCFVVLGWWHWGDCNCYGHSLVVILCLMVDDETVYSNHGVAFYSSILMA